MHQLRYFTETALTQLLEQVAIPELVGRLRPLEAGEVGVEALRLVVVLEGWLSVAEQTVRVYVGLPVTFPFHLPLVYLAEPEQVGPLPHVLSVGYVCYAQAEGLMLDRHNPAGIIEQALSRAAATISEGLSGANEWDFVDEFESYWSLQAGISEIESYVEPSGDVREVVLARQRDPRNGFVWVADGPGSVGAFTGNYATTQTLLNGLYIPLEPNTLVRPPLSSAPWSLDELRALVWAHLSERNRRVLEKLTSKHKRDEVLIIRLPRRTEGEVIFGIWCHGVDQAHPLQPNGTAQQLVPLCLRRRDRRFLLPRGGAVHALADARVAIVGCGSVGGYVALELVRLGILNLTLIDPDIVREENIFRHVVGKQGLGKHKVDALRDELTQKTPYARVRPMATFIEPLLEEDWFAIHQFDLIVVAIGDVSLHLLLNQAFHQQIDCPPVIYGWLEAYGIGGHVQITLNQERRGCLECLYTPTPLDDDPMHDRSAFAAPNQNFSKNIAGCGSIYTPFRSLDALRTAALIAKAAADVLLGRAQGNPLLHWKGDSTDFQEAGYQLSRSYKLSSEELFARRYGYANPRCRVCGGEG